MTAVLVFGFLLWTYLNAVSAHAKGIVPGVIPITALGLAIAVPFLVRAARDGVAFTATALTIVLLTATLFLNLYPRVLVSSTDKAYSLTIWSTSSTHYTLVVMTIVALALTPVVLLYQGWTYYVFRHRISRDDLMPLKSPIELLSGGDDHKPAASNDRAERMRSVDQRLLRVSPAARAFLAACVPLGRRDRTHDRRPGDAARPDRRRRLPAASGSGGGCGHAGTARRRGARARCAGVGLRGRGPPRGERDRRSPAPTARRVTLSAIGREIPR